MGQISPNPADPPTPSGARKRTGFVGNPRRANRDDALTEAQFQAIHRAGLFDVCFDEFGCAPSELSASAATALLAWYERENEHDSFK